MEGRERVLKKALGHARANRLRKSANFHHKGSALSDERHRLPLMLSILGVLSPGGTGCKGMTPSPNEGPMYSAGASTIEVGNLI